MQHMNFWDVSRGIHGLEHPQNSPVPADLTTVESGVPEPMQGQDTFAPILFDRSLCWEEKVGIARVASRKPVAAGILFPVRDFSDSQIVLLRHLSTSKCSGPTYDVEALHFA